MSLRRIAPGHHGLTIHVTTKDGLLHSCDPPSYFTKIFIFVVSADAFVESSGRYEWTQQAQELHIIVVCIPAQHSNPYGDLTLETTKR
jgi:hypothetical protein